MTTGGRRPATRPPRVVLDTNVVLSALVFARGPIAIFRSLWQSGAFVPLASRSTVEELIRVLAYPKFKLDESARRELLSDYLPWTETVSVPEPPPPVPACRDPFDRPFLELAVAGKAQYLVTGDADLQALAGARRRPALAFRIATPSYFLSCSSG